MPRPFVRQPDLGGRFSKTEIAAGVYAEVAGSSGGVRVRPIDAGDYVLQLLHDYVLAQGGGVVQLEDLGDYTAQAGGLAPQVLAIGSGFTSKPTLTVPLPDLPGGERAEFDAYVEGGGVWYARVVKRGRGYTQEKDVLVTGGGGTGCVIKGVPVGLCWMFSKVGLEGRGSRISTPDMARGFGMQVHSQTAPPWYSRGPVLPFGWFELVGPGGTGVHAAQTNPTDGILYGQSLGANKKAAGSTSNVVLQQVTVRGYRDNRVYGDTSYIISHSDSRSCGFWRSGDSYISGADAGENYVHQSGVWADGQYTGTGVCRLAVIQCGATYTTPRLVIDPPPGWPESGVRATGTVRKTAAGRLLDAAIDNPGQGYDKASPPAVTVVDDGGTGTGAVVSAFCHASAIWMPTAGNADVRLFGPSLDYCDQLAAVLGGSLVINGHLEMAGKRPLIYAAQGTSHIDGGSEVVYLNLAGCEVSPTARDGEAPERDAIILVDNVMGGSNVSVVAPCKYNTSGYRTEIIKVANEGGQIKKLDLRGADIGAAPAPDALERFTIPGGYLNQLFNADFSQGTTGWDWSAPANGAVAVSGSTLTITGTGAGITATGGGYAFRQLVPVRPGETAFSAQTFLVTATSGTATIAIAYYDDRKTWALPSAKTIYAGGSTGAMIRRGGNNNAAPKGARWVGISVQFNAFVGTLQLQAPYLCVL